MRTAITYTTKDHHFGGNFNYEMSYNEVVTITPGNYHFDFRKVKSSDKRYAMVGIAVGVSGCPLYHEATDERGLSIAGLNSPGDADCKELQGGKDSIAPFEFIPWMLGQCSTIGEAKELSATVNLVNIDSSEELPLSLLHWLLAGKEKSIVTESTKDGLHLCGSPVGVLTNNPPFDCQLFNLNNYRSLSNGTEV